MIQDQMFFGICSYTAMIKRQFYFKVFFKYHYLMKILTRIKMQNRMMSKLTVFRHCHCTSMPYCIGFIFLIVWIPTQMVTHHSKQNLMVGRWVVWEYDEGRPNLASRVYLGKWYGNGGDVWSMSWSFKNVLQCWWL